MSRHIAPRQSRRTRKRTRRTIIAASILAAVTLIAVALTLLRAPISGQLQIPLDEPDAVEFTQFQQPSASSMQPSSAVDCEQTLDGTTGVLNMTVHHFNGSASQRRCFVQAKIKLAGDTNADWVVQDVIYNEATDVVFAAPTGQTIACGKSVTADSELSLWIRATVPTAVTAGTYPADGEAGVVVVEADEYIDADCPRAS